MSNAERLCRALDSVESNLVSDIGVGCMADAACLSPFYFSRIFSSAFLVGPWEWIVRRRLSEAGKRLMAGTTDATTAAFEFGFSGLDVFARSMRRAYGVLPSDLLRGAVPVRPFLERPPADVVSLCCDPARNPRITVLDLPSLSLSGETLYAAKSLPRAIDQEIIDTLDLNISACLVVDRGSFGQMTVSLAGETPIGSGSLDIRLCGGKWLCCAFSELSDYFPARKWLYSVALSVLPVVVEAFPEVTEYGQGSALRIRLELV